MKKNKLVCVCLFLLALQLQLYCLESEITAIGTLYPSAKSLISTQVAGRVETFFVDVGHPVGKNQPIAQLDKRYYEIDFQQKSAALASAKIEMVDAEKNFLRMKKLWEKPEGETPSIPLKRFEDAKVKYEQAIAQVKQAEENFNRAKLSLEETLIKSPYQGIVTKKFVDIGESIPVQPVTNIVEVQALNPLYLEFCVPQIYAPSLRVGTPLSYEIEGIDSKEAHIDLLYPSLDETTRSLRCRAVIENEQGLVRPGSLARIKIQIQTDHSHKQGNPT